jgi:hypothetical protein
MVINRRRFKQVRSLQERLADEAENLRNVADALPQGPNRTLCREKPRQDGAACLSGNLSVAITFRITTERSWVSVGDENAQLRSRLPRVSGTLLHELSQRSETLAGSRRRNARQG